MSVEKAELVCEDKKSMSIVTQFNPTSFHFERKVNWAEQSPALQPHTLVQYGNGSSDTLTVSLLLDTTESDASVLPEIKRFYDLTLPRIGLTHLTPRPPVVAFTWQAFRFRGVVTTMNFEVLLFDNDGHPKRATVELNLLGEAFPALSNPLNLLPI